MAQLQCSWRWPLSRHIRCIAILHSKTSTRYWSGVHYSNSSFECTLHIAHTYTPIYSTEDNFLALHSTMCLCYSRSFGNFHSYFLSFILFSHIFFPFCKRSIKWKFSPCRELQSIFIQTLFDFSLTCIHFHFSFGFFALTPKSWFYFNLLQKFYILVSHRKMKNLHK